MPEVKDIGTIIASREMEFIHENEEKAFLKVGMPFEYGEGYDWCCPYELSTESSKKLFSMFGIDALQSLELTMKILGWKLSTGRSQKGQVPLPGRRRCRNMTLLIQ